MNIFEQILSAGDLRTIGKSQEVVALVDNQEKFDELFNLLYHPNRKIVMRAADAIEKITAFQPSFLAHHTREILDFVTSARNMEFKWHLAQLVERCDLNDAELENVWKMIAHWATDKKESRIVRVHSLQSLYNIAQRKKGLFRNFLIIVKHVEKENVPSLNARIRKFQLSHS